MIVRADSYLPSVSRLASRSPSAIMSTKDVVPSPKAFARWRGKALGTRVKGVGVRKGLYRAAIAFLRQRWPKSQSSLLLASILTRRPNSPLLKPSALYKRLHSDCIATKVWRSAVVSTVYFFVSCFFGLSSMFSSSPFFALSYYGGPQ